MSVVDQDTVLEQFKLELRNLKWKNEVLEHSDFVTRRCCGDGLSCQVGAYALEAESLDAVIRAEAGLARGRGMSLEWKVFSFDFPPNLVDQLALTGFSIGPKEAVLVYDLSDGLGVLSSVEASHVKPVRSRGQLHDYRTATEAAFGEDARRTTSLLAEALDQSEDYVQGYVAYEGAEPCSVGRLYTNRLSRFGGLYGGGTVPAFRNRGHYRAVVAARARRAQSVGASYLLTDALPTSLPILLRLGFVHVADTWPCTLD